MHTPTGILLKPSADPIGSLRAEVSLTCPLEVRMVRFSSGTCSLTCTFTCFIQQHRRRLFKTLVTYYRRTKRKKKKKRRN